MLRQGITLYKERLRNVVQQGDLYRMESPYDGPRATLDYVTYDQSRAVLFIYQLKEGPSEVVKPMGLDPQQNYRLTEVNVPEGQKSGFSMDGMIKSGAELMRDGFIPTTQKEYDSMVIEFSALTQIADYYSLFLIDL